MTTTDATSKGARDALLRFKLAGPMGADSGVMPKGDEQSHGTDRVQYARKDTPDPSQTPSWWRDVMPDWLWDNFTSYDNIGPGRAHEYGQEVIG